MPKDMTIGFGRMGTALFSPIAAPTWFLFPSRFFDDDLVASVSAAAIKIYGFVLRSQHRPNPPNYETNAEWAAHLGMGEQEFIDAVLELVRLNTAQCVFRHSCGHVFYDETGECPGCHGETTGNDTRMMVVPVHAMEQATPAPVTKPRKAPTKRKPAAKPKGSPETPLGDGEVPQSEFTDLVQRLTVATGIHKDMLGGAFWGRWQSARKSMRKKLDGTPYGDVDIQKALPAFYAANYSFEHPEQMVSDLLLAISGKLQKRYKKDNRPALYFPTKPSPKVARSDDEITLDEVMANCSPDEVLTADRGYI